MNIQTLLILAVIAWLAFRALRTARKGTCRCGGGSCGCSCEGCTKCKRS